MEGADRAVHCLEQVAAQLPMHERWFMGLMFKPLPSAMEHLHSQRLLLLFFGVLGSDAAGADWLAARTPRLVEAIVCEVRRCYDAVSGGFLSEPSGSFVGVPTLTMTHCAVHVLWVVGALEDALSTWLDPKALRSFVLACRAGWGSAEGRSGAFAAFPASSEIDVRFTYSALTILRLAAVSDSGGTSAAQHPWRQGVVPPAQVYAEQGDASIAVLLEEAQRYLLNCWSPLEGGFGGTPGAEAHGGMTFCAVASLALLGWWDAGSVESRRMRRQTLRYCTARVGFGPEANEDDTEGEASHWERVQFGIGFQGRPNKPHDTCYTFWLGGALHILEEVEWRGMEACERAAEVQALAGSEAHHQQVVGSLVDDYTVARFVVSCCGSSGGFGRDDGDVDPLHAALALAGLASRIPVKQRRIDPTTSRSCTPVV